MKEIRTGDEIFISAKVIATKTGMSAPKEVKLEIAGHKFWLKEAEAYELGFYSEEEI